MGIPFEHCGLETTLRCRLSDNPHCHFIYHLEGRESCPTGIPPYQAERDKESQKLIIESMKNMKEVTGFFLYRGADDLLPRLMTVIASCGLPNLFAEAMYMENFMPTDRALGEAGYSLTVLQSVLSCFLPHSG